MEIKREGVARREKKKEIWRKGKREKDTEKGKKIEGVREDRRTGESLSVGSPGLKGSQPCSHQLGLVKCQHGPNCPPQS